MKGVYACKGTLTGDSMASKFNMKFKNIEALMVSV